MPIHDWTRVKAGIFHDFRHSWIEQIQRALNSEILSPEYDALAEQQTPSSRRRGKNPARRLHIRHQFAKVSTRRAVRNQRGGGSASRFSDGNDLPPPMHSSRLLVLIHES